MLAASASLFNIKIAVLDVGEDAFAKQVISLPAPATPQKLSHIDGSFKYPTKIKELAATVDVLTVDVDALEQVQWSTNILVWG